jgi:O-antigen/teichoic acid export membrane protein
VSAPGRTPPTAAVLAGAAATGWAAKALAIATSLVTLPLVMAALGAEHYGIWVLVGQVTTLIGLTDLGVTNAVGRFVAQVRARDEGAAMGRLLTTAMLMLAAAAGLVLAVTFALLPWIAALLRIEPHYAELTRTVFLIAGIGLALQFPLRIGFGILAGHQRYAVTNLAKMAGLAINLTGVVLLAVTGRLDLVSLALLSVGATLGVQLVMCVMGARLVWPARTDAVFSRGWARDLMGLGGSALGVTASGALYRQGLVVAVGIMLGLRSAAVYGVVLTLMTHLAGVLSEMPRPMVTLASEWKETSESDRLRNNTLRVMALCFALALTAAGGTWFYGEPILRLLLSASDWTAAEFTLAGSALMIMGAGLAVGIPQIVSRSVLQGLGWHWAVMRRFFFATIVAFVVGLGGMALGYGLTAAATGWALTWALQGLVLYPPLVRRVLKVSFTTMIRRGYLPGAAVGAAAIVAMAAVAAVIPPTTVAGIAAGGILGVAVCAVGLGLVAVPASARRSWLRRARIA